MDLGDVLPLFVLVLLGPPSVERLRHHAGLSAALTGITFFCAGAPVPSLSVDRRRGLVASGIPG